MYRIFAAATLSVRTEYWRRYGHNLFVTVSQKTIMCHEVHFSFTKDTSVSQNLILSHNSQNLILSHKIQCGVKKYKFNCATQFNSAKQM